VHSHEHHVSDFNWDELHTTEPLKNNASNWELWRDYLDPSVLKSVSDILNAYDNEERQSYEYQEPAYVDEVPYSYTQRERPRVKPAPRQYPERSRWRSGWRGKRHVGIHDEGGLQRLISTGKNRIE
jgi:hypothetical protein